MKSGKLWMPVLLFFWMGCIAATNQGGDMELGTLTGQVVGENGSITMGVVSFFTTDNGPPIDRGVVRRVPELVVRIEQEGRFRANMPAGRYYVGVLQRERDRGGPWPPRPGEKFFFALDEAKELRVFTVQAGKTVDVGPVSGAIPHIVLDPDQYFNVRGTVRYEDGRPFAGAYVTAKKDLTTPRPLFISRPTDEAGRYSILLPPNEPFHIGALENLSGGWSPVPSAAKHNMNPPVTIGSEGSYVAGKQITGKPGELLEGIDITMYKVMDPEQVRTEMLNKAKAQPLPEQGLKSDSTK